MKKNGIIEVIECNTVIEAENEYFRRRKEGCWQMVKVLEIKWSWKKFRKVATFSMKKVEKSYHFDDYMRDLNNCVTAGIKTFKKINNYNTYRK